jgi:choline dehydrogenase-like flavoprotein
VAFQRHPHCQCTNQPVIGDNAHPTVDPSAYFDSLSEAEQNATFGRAGAQAIRDGADMNSVVNIRRKGALYTTNDAYGRRVLATREGTTRRGAYYRAARARASRETGIQYARDRIETAQGLPTFRLTSPRLTPEAIYQTAASREQAIELLRQYGYFR